MTKALGRRARTAYSATLTQSRGSETLSVGIQFTSLLAFPGPHPGVTDRATEALWVLKLAQKALLHLGLKLCPWGASLAHQLLASIIPARLRCPSGQLNGVLSPAVKSSGASGEGAPVSRTSKQGGWGHGFQAKAPRRPQVAGKA